MLKAIVRKTAELAGLRTDVAFAIEQCGSRHSVAVKHYLENLHAR